MKVKVNYEKKEKFNQIFEDFLKYHDAVKATK